MNMKSLSKNMNMKQLKRAWKYRNYLWRHRTAIRRRRQIAWMAGAGLVAAAAGILVRRNRIEQMNAQQG